MQPQQTHSCQITEISVRTAAEENHKLRLQSRRQTVEQSYSGFSKII